MLDSRFLGFFGRDSARLDHLSEVVLGVVWNHALSAWLLNIVDLDREVVLVGDAEPSRDVELLQALADVLQLLVGHLRVQLVAERGTDEEKPRNNLWLLVEAASVAHFTIFKVALAKSVLEGTVVLLHRALLNGQGVLLAALLCCCLLLIDD